MLQTLVETIAFCHGTTRVTRRRHRVHDNNNNNNKRQTRKH